MSLNVIRSAALAQEPGAPAVLPQDAAAADLRNSAFEVLRHACAGRPAAAAAALEHLYCLRGRFHAYALLQDVVAGKQPCQSAGALFVLGNVQISSVMQRHFDEAIAACQAFLGLPVPCILLQCKDENRDLHLTMESFPGLALLRLSSLSAGYPDDLRAVQFHEIAHCFLTCGVRLLDEGLAHLFAARYAAASLPEADPGLLPDMRTLLSRSSDNMFGESVDSNLAVYRSACRVGADLLERIFTLGGAGRIVRLFAEVARAGSEERVLQLVQQASEQLFPLTQVAVAPDAAQAALIDAARAAIFTAWINKAPGDLDACIAQLEAAPVYAAPALLDSLVAAQLNRALLQVNFGSKPTREQEAHLDMLLKAGECLPPGRLWLWRGTRAILAILLARPNIIKVASAGQQALKAFARADELIPGDPDLLVQHASLLLNAPPEYGGDRDLGVHKLRQAMDYPAYREHARQVLLEYGVEQEARPDGAPADMPTPARVASDAPLLLQVQGVELKFSTYFTLQPGDFSVRRGERVALVGRNGSGKSMLLETLLGLRQPQRGSVQFCLAQGGMHAAADIRQKIGGLLQGADFPGLSRVREIMALHQAAYRRTDPAVTRALGLDELAGRFWQQLSRGQKQRVLLWLALAHVPEIVLLDEPSLGLDEWFLRALRELLEKLPVSVLMISHVPSDLLGADRILCMDDGKIVADGCLADLMLRQVGVYKAQILQSVSDDALSAMQAMGGLVRAPLQREKGWELYGQPGFDVSFRRLIEEYRISSFSLQAASVEDFLAAVAHD